MSPTYPVSYNVDSWHGYFYLSAKIYGQLIFCISGFSFFYPEILFLPVSLCIFSFINSLLGMLFLFYQVQWESIHKGSSSLKIYLLIFWFYFESTDVTYVQVFYEYDLLFSCMLFFRFYTYIYIILYSFGVLAFYTVVSVYFLSFG